MRMLALGALIMLSGCMTGMVSHSDARGSELAATLRAASGAERGAVTIASSGERMRVRIAGTGLPQGAHGVHIHSVGRCDAPDFTTAGDHWNPTMKQHGRDNPMGAHRGDLPNLLIGTDGRGSVSFDLPVGNAPLLDDDGAAIVVHAAPDDFKTDPSGNSGARIACGVLTAR